MAIATNAVASDHGSESCCQLHPLITEVVSEFYKRSKKLIAVARSGVTFDSD